MSQTSPVSRSGSNLSTSLKLILGRRRRITTDRMQTQKFSLEWAGRNLEIEVGKFAGQANGACTVRYGDTVVLATATMSDNIREGIGFFPLMVDYEERLYAAGKIKSSRFMKREGRPTDEAILTGRLVDRSIRPLFDDRMRNDIQVVLTVFSVDGENDSDIPALVAASAALMISDIPWDGPIAGIRIGKVGDELVLNPTFAAREKSELDLVVAGTKEKVIMLEAGAKELPEETVREAVALAQKHLHAVSEFIKEIKNKVGKEKRIVDAPPATEEEAAAREEEKVIVQKTEEFLVSRYENALFGNPQASKKEKRTAREELEEKVDEHLKESGYGKEKRKIGVEHAGLYMEQAVSKAILDKNLRVDGRSLTDIRPLSVEISAIPRTHGSAVFSRGETQVLNAVTLGAPGDEQTLEGMELSGKKRYFHHYNFPSYSVGETGPNRGPGRREIGHGALAERAVEPLLPPREEFPYTIRSVSEVLSSNGSSSMASTCSSSLALMDAGVPLKSHCAGIAMGLASDDSGRWKVLTDLQDLEDGDGGMDFKIAGTRIGITAIQMDTKTSGLTPEIVEITLKQAHEARMKILDAMEAVIPAPRPELSPYAPRIISFHINPDSIRTVIGPGGKMINEIIDKTGVTIDIENDGLVLITSTNAEAAQKASEWIKNLTREVKVGEIFEGKVTRLMEFGAFVEILPKQEGLVHISELSDKRVDRVSDVVNIGDTVSVKVIEIDSMGRTNLSMRQAKNPDAPVEVRKRDEGDRRGREPRRERRGPPRGHGR